MTVQDHEIRLIDATRRFVADYVMPNASRWERERALPHEAFKRAAALGLTAIEVPTALGGMGCSFTPPFTTSRANIAADIPARNAHQSQHIQKQMRKILTHSCLQFPNFIDAGFDVSDTLLVFKVLINIFA